jgi:pimeloyl-ACP methyl ester carboxylesterase
MRYRMEELGVEVIRAESERFSVPLLLLHGLWTGSWLWGRMAGYLSHRGWESWAPDYTGRPGGPPAGHHGDDPVAAVLAQCLAVAQAMPEPPILVAHDSGAALAIRLARDASVRALVLIAPAMPGTGALRVALGAVGRAWAGIRGRPLGPPGGAAAAALLAGTDAEAVDLLRQRFVPEPGRLAYDLLRGRLVAGPTSAPLLVIGGARDAVTPPAAVARVAETLGGSSVILPGAHWLPIEARWRETTNCVHRWIVRTLGAPILLLREEEDEEGP